MRIASVTALRGVGPWEACSALDQNGWCVKKNMRYGYNLKNSFLRGSGFEPSKRNKIGNGHGVLPSKMRCFWEKGTRLKGIGWGPARPWGGRRGYLGSLEKSQLRNVVLLGVSNRFPPKSFVSWCCSRMRVSIGFLRENSISWRCSYADFWKKFGAVMVLLSGVINVCWIRQRFVPCVAGPLKGEPSFGAAGWPHLRCPLNVLSW